MSTYNIFVVKDTCVCMIILHNCKPSGYARVLQHPSLAFATCVVEKHWFLDSADEDFHSSFPQWSPTRVVDPAAADYEPLNGPCKLEASLVDGASIWLSSWEWDV